MRVNIHTNIFFLIFVQKGNLGDSFISPRESFEGVGLVRARAQVMMDTRCSGGLP